MTRFSDRVIHGGRLNQAAKEFAIRKDQWLDLSTGINPYSYPLGSPAEHIWRSLPEDDDGLVAAAQQYYTCQSLIMTPGSQWSIAKIPSWCQALGNKNNIVLLPEQGYQEHYYAWQKAGFDCQFYTVSPSEQQLAKCAAMIVINPNNPSGDKATKAQLLQWHTTLLANGAWLIVDEAFIDVEPSQSMAEYIGLTGLVVLRSLGKFFGLAGARVGALLAWPHLLHFAAAELEPWSIASPSRWAAQQALQDITWQKNMRTTLGVESQQLARLLSDTFSAPSRGCALFQTVWLSDAKNIYQQLARKGILVRLLSEYKHSGLRFGLPNCGSTDRNRLTQALNALDCKKYES